LFLQTVNYMKMCVFDLRNGQSAALPQFTWVINSTMQSISSFTTIYPGN
jgi:hypothetical protein